MRSKVFWFVPVLGCFLVLVTMVALAAKPTASQAGNRAEPALDSNSPVYAGEQAIFEATLSGTLPYTHAWDFDDGSDVYTGVASLDPFSVSHIYESPGMYSVTVEVTDSVPAQYSGGIWMEVVASFSDITLEHSASPLAGEAVAFTATLEGGKSPFAYTWLFGDDTIPLPGIALAGKFTASHVYSFTGAFSATVYVTDDMGTARSQADHILVDCPDITVVLTDSGPAQAGLPVWFTATVSGGKVPYSYFWDFDDGVSEGGSIDDMIFSTTHRFGAGTYSVTLALADVHNCSAPVASTQVEITNTRLYLPLVVRKARLAPLPPPIITNGGFEEGSFVGWSQGGALPRTIVTTLHTGTVFSGTYSALLGDPALGDGGAGNVPVGSAWITQTVTIPEGRTGILSLHYRLQGWDGLNNDRFRACLTDMDTLFRVLLL